jgi:hypothetical protein
MFNHFHIETHNHHNSKDDHNLLPIPHDMVTTTQLQNYKKNYATPSSRVMYGGHFQRV